MDDGSQTKTDNFAPISMECVAPHLPVLGELPSGLHGTLYRNGPNPQFSPGTSGQSHWFSGDGMVHGFTLHNGHASYRNRWVRTGKWRAEGAAGHGLVSGYFVTPTPEADFADEGVANTNVVWHAGRLLALEEGHLPIELDPSTLTTRGVQNFGGALHGSFTAHPKVDPTTGELIFFGYGANDLTPEISYGTIGPDGKVSRIERFEAPYCSMVHDFAVTEHHVLFPILPLSGSRTRAQTGQSPYAWEPELGGYIGVIARDQGVGSLRWFRAPSCYVFHVLNAWEVDGCLVVDVMQYDEPPLFPRADGRSVTGNARAHLVRWTLDPAASTDMIIRTQLDDIDGEFPRIDDRAAGKRNRFGMFAGHSTPAAGTDSIVWLDLIAGKRILYTLPPGDGVSEPIFVPRHAAAEEGDGWVLAVAWRGEQRRSDLLVFDTGGFDCGPVATVQLSHRVPFGFHGNWASSAA